MSSATPVPPSALSPVYQHVVGVMGMPDAMARVVVGDLLRARGMSEKSFDLEQLKALLPEIQERLDRILPESQGRELVQRVEKMIQASGKSGKKLDR